MQVHTVTVRLDPETGAFPPDPLAHVDGELISVDERPPDNRRNHQGLRLASASRGPTWRAHACTT